MMFPDYNRGVPSEKVLLLLTLSHSRFPQGTTGPHNSKKTSSRENMQLRPNVRIYAAIQHKKSI
jgi:hypothetical protein